MGSINLSACLAFVFVTTFTPGPNNISSSSMGILYGYRRSIPYLLGIASGFFGIMMLCGVVSRTLYDIFPTLESAMRVAGAAYILWLAYKTLKSSYQYAADASAVLGFADGLLLQALNPKVWVYGLTLYATFLASITGNVLLLIISACLLAGLSFSSISTWAVSGVVIKRALREPRYQKGVNIGLALLLVYTAVELSGLL